MKPNVILFDLGGVLIEVVSEKRLFELIGGRMTLDEVSKKWSNSDDLALLESGLTDATAFAKSVIEDFDLALSPEAFLSEFSLFPKDFLPGAKELLEEAAGRYTLACLTDTNAPQWESLSLRISLDRYFSKHFLSYEIGKRKPDPAVYSKVVEALACDPFSIFYFDDKEANVEAGKRAGLHAYQVCGVSELQAKMKDLGLI